jgi:ornithine cyclodeaminase/alanine dehydrogenase-like protein (mu-crystallin family)
MLILSEEFISSALSMKTTIELVEQAFSAAASNDAVVFPAIVDYVGSARAHVGIKSGYLRIPQANGAYREVLGLKAGGYWLGNQERYGLPNHRATLLLLDPMCGEPLALMPANTITRMRTAAAGAVAARHLARRNSSTVAILGTGEQAHAQLEALRVTHDIRRVFVWGRRPKAVASYADTWRSAHGLEVIPTTALAESLQQSDIIVTTTPATEALVMSAWVRPGTHVNAVGSDGAGKKELDPELIRRAKFVADRASQSETIGELQNVAPRADGKALIYAELGEICNGSKVGRANNDEITVFDSSGVNFQDLVVADYLVRQSIQRQLAAP